MEEKLINEIFNEDTDKVLSLLKESANVNYIAQNGDTPLSVAVETQNYGLVKLLLENGANPNLSTHFPILHTAIDTAVEATKNNEDILEDSTKIIELLLQYNAGSKITDENGKTAYEFAKDYHLPAEELLKNYN